MNVRISLSNSGGFSAALDRSVLDSALAQGENLPHGCKGGNCGACRARLLAGRVHYPRGAPLGLSSAEIDDGYVLLCQAHPVTDLVLEKRAAVPADLAEVHRLPARIERSIALSPDVQAVYLRLPAAEPWCFQPGQYLDFILPRGRRRSFSIASPPHDAQLLELHVRRVPGGEFTTWLWAAERAGSLVSIEGPCGRFVYRPGLRPLLLIGGGTGLAPLKSILRHLLETQAPRAVTLYWGVRSQVDLYADAELQALSRRYPAFRYHAVLSMPDVGWRGRSGWVHRAAFEEVADLEAHDVYASGPPQMIMAIRNDYAARGADPAQLCFDSFDYADDSPARQRTMAPTS